MFVPTPTQRTMVRMGTAYGIPQIELVQGIVNPSTGRPISIDTLRVAFEPELREGKLQMDLVVANSMTEAIRAGQPWAISMYASRRLAAFKPDANEAKEPENYDIKVEFVRAPQKRIGNGKTIEHE